MDEDRIPDCRPVEQPPRIALRTARLPIDRRQMAGILALTGALLASLALPHTGDVSGLDVLFGSPDAGALIRFRSNVYTWSVIATSAAALAATLSRRWAVAVSAAASAVLSTLAAIFAAWTQQTAGGNAEAVPGAGPGLFLGLLISAALTYRLTALACASPLSPDRQVSSTDIEGAST